MSVVIITLSYVTLLFYGTFEFVVSKLEKFSISVKVLDDLSFSMVYTVHLSSCYNFFIYLVFNDIYRENFKAMLWKYCCSCCVFGGDTRQGNHVVPVQGEGVAAVIEMDNC